MTSIHNQKHLSYDDRSIIQESLEKDISMKEIASLLNKDNSTISKEIKLRRQKVDIYTSHFTKNNNCFYLNTCQKSNICISSINCSNKLCKRCNMCVSVCKDYSPNICKRLSRAPHVCNGCSNHNFKCEKSHKYIYKAILAHNQYISDLSESHQGINMSSIEFSKLNDLISPLIKDNGQSLNHIIATHNDQITCSNKTLYNYINTGYLDCRNIDLPRKIKFKPRHSNSHLGRPCLKNKEIRINRTYDDYLKYIDDHPDLSVVEMDTVEGIKGNNESVLLTLMLTKSNLQIAHKLPAKTATNVSKTISLYQELLGDSLFKEVFSVILTDNGSEFTDPNYIEAFGVKVFYCDSNVSYQKERCENNHEFIRRYIPKGNSINPYKQSKICLMMSHINSVKRQSLDNKSPYEVTSNIWGEDLLKRLHITATSPDKVILKPYLIK